MGIHHRVCNLCEAMCGLEIHTEGANITHIIGDKQDTFSRGHICPKAVGLKDIYEDPNRLKFPMKRTGDTWAEISWEQAFNEVTEELRKVRSRYGADSVAVYAGNPSVHNSGTMLSAPGFFKALGTKQFYSASSADQFPHHFAAWALFGHPMLMPVPDIDNTDLWVIFGGNPIASNGSIMTAPDVAKRLTAIQERNGKVIVIDPRRTETAQKASEHLFIRPNADVFLLLAIVQVLFEENLVNLGRLAAFTDGLADLHTHTQAYTPESVSDITGITPEAIRTLTRQIATTPRAAVYGRVGVSTQEFGGLSLWLIAVVNILTNHLDEPGGMMFTTPAFDYIGMGNRGVYNKFERYRSRVSDRPEFLGEFPVACLAEEMLTEGDGQVKAFVTSCGNPVLSIPNGPKLEAALENLDFMVSVDIYLNETTRHAHYILPPATGVETAHYDITFHTLAIRNTARYSQPILEKHPNARYDWEIFQELQNRLEGTPKKPTDPAFKLDAGLQMGSHKLSLQTLKDNPHGIDLGPLESRLPDRLFTANKRINLVPSLLVADLSRTEKYLKSFDNQSDKLLLIGRRHLRDNNSWMHNVHRLVKGRNRCILQLHPNDAQKRGLVTGEIVSVTSRVGVVQIEIELTDSMMEGVACMPHGYGHNRPGTRLDIAQQRPGVSFNDLSDETIVDTLIGNAVFNGVPIQVAKILV